MGAEQIREIPVWVGRDALLDELARELLENRRKAIVLVGQGGIGKTSLAVKLLERAGIDLRSGHLAEHCDYVRIVYVRVAEGIGFEEVAGDILRGAIADIGGIKPEALLRLVVEQMQKASMLLVLDNLEDILQAAGEPQPGRAKSKEWGQLLNHLAHKNHDSQIVITSREKPKDLADVRARGNTIGSRQVKIYEIDGLSAEAGAEAFRANGVEDDLPSLRRVAERVGGHTLGIELLAGFAVEYLEGYLCAYLEAHPELFTADLEPILIKQWERQEEATRDLLKRMCVLRVPIDIEGLTFLRGYGEEEEPNPPAPFPAREGGAKGEGGVRVPSFLGFLWGKRQPESPSPRRGGVGEGSDPQTQVRETEALINRLVDCQLVRRRFDKTAGKHFYDLHRVIADFAQTQCGERLPELLRSVYSFYQAGAEVENPKTLEELRPMLEAQHFAFQLGNYGEAKNLIYRLEKYLEPWGYWGLLLELCEQIVHKLDEESQPYILQRIGLRHRDWGDWNEAERYYRQGLRLAEKHQNRGMIAGLLGQLGDIERNRGNWDAAEQLYRQYQQLREELGDRAGMASSWGCLGDIERKRGNWDAAERLYRQCLQVEEELGDRAGMASSWGQLGDIERKRGNWDAAEQLYRQSLQLREELGDRSGMATSWGQLGDIERKRGNWDAAEQLYRQYQQLREELGDRSGMASSWGCLGDIERNRGNWDAAEQLYRQYQQMCEELGDQSGIAAVWGCLGENELGRGNLDKAEELLTQALTQMQELGMTWHIAETHWDLAQLYRQRNNPELAQHHYKTAHQLFTQLGAKKDIEKIEREWENLED